MRYRVELDKRAVKEGVFAVWIARFVVEEQGGRICAMDREVCCRGAYEEDRSALEQGVSAL